MQKPGAQGGSGYEGQKPIKSRQYLYHYTNDKGIEGIKESGIIKPSTDTVRDAMLGEAPYFTDMSPRNPKAVILENNYGADPRHYQRDRADNYVQIPKKSVETLKATDTGRSVYRGLQEGQPLDLGQIPGVKFGKHSGK